MRCPVCHDEFKRGVDRCPECLVPLVPAIPSGLEDESGGDQDLVLAVELFSPVEAEIVTSLLRAHDIPCLLKAENQYAVEANYSIGPLARRRVLVRPGDLDRAQDLLKAFPMADGESDFSR